MSQSFLPVVSAKEDGTRVHVRKKGAWSPLRYTLHRARPADLSLSTEDHVSIRADRPVQVIQYVLTHFIQDTGCDGGPACTGAATAALNTSALVLSVPPLHGKQQQYLFSTPTAAGRQSVVNLVIATPLRDGVLLNGSDLVTYINASRAAGTTQPVWRVLNSDVTSDAASQTAGNLSTTRFWLPPGLHLITHSNASALDSGHVLFSATSVPHSSGTSRPDTPKEPRPNDTKLKGKIPNNVPEATVEKAKVDDEINNALLTKTGSDASGSHQGDEISPSVIAVLISLCSAVLFVIICIVGFVFAEFAFHNGEKSLFRLSRVAPYEPIED